MNKEQRLQLIRARHRALFGIRKIQPPTRRRIMAPVRRATWHNSDMIATTGPGRRKWVYLADNRPKNPLLTVKRLDDEPSPLTRIAQKIYEYQRVPWSLQGRRPDADSSRRGKRTAASNHESTNRRADV